jgi:hypothetical protein
MRQFVKRAKIPAEARQAKSSLAMRGCVVR